MTTVTATRPADLIDEAIKLNGKYLTAEPAVDTAIADEKGKAGPSEDLAPFIKAELSSYPRPNGVDYLPRRMKIGETALHDVTFIKVAHDKRMPVLLYGDPGCGKTALVEAAIPDLITVQGTVETETADFVGGWTQQTDGTYRWVDGPLVVAAETGVPLLIDEIALIDPRVMAVVYALMDGRDKLEISANPERDAVVPKDGFMVFGACNPNVPGAVMSDALLSRFALHVEMTTDWGLCKRLGILPEITTVARNLHTKAQRGEVMAAPQIRELLTFTETVKVFGLQLALRNFIAQARPEDREHFIEAIKATFADTDKITALKL